MKKQKQKISIAQLVMDALKKFLQRESE